MTKKETYDKLRAFLAGSEEQGGFNWQWFRELMKEAIELTEPPEVTLEVLRTAADILPVAERIKVTTTVCSLRTMIDDPIVGEAWRAGIKLIHAEMEAAHVASVQPEPAIQYGAELDPYANVSSTERTPNPNTD